MGVTVTFVGKLLKTTPDWWQEQHFQKQLLDPGSNLGPLHASRMA